MEKADFRSELLEGLNSVLLEYLQDYDIALTFERLLGILLKLSQSKYGFIGAVRDLDTPKPYLQTLSLTDISWNAETKKLYEENKLKGFRFDNMNTLFGAAILSGETVIANNPREDPRRGGIPGQHPPLDAFMGIPIYHNKKQIGLIGLANREGGFSEDLEQTLAPFTRVCSVILNQQNLLRERDEAQKVLTDAQNLQRSIFESTIDSLIIIDYRGVIQQVNQAALAEFGYTEGELIGQNVKMLMTEPFAHDHDQYLKNYLTTGKKISSARDVKYQRSARMAASSTPACR